LIGEVRLDRQDPDDEIHSGRPPLDNFDIKALAILEKYLIESARSMAETLLAGHTIVLRHLQESLGFKSFDLHWILHVLTDELGNKRTNYAKRMLPFLHAAERNGWHHLMSSDELFFEYITASHVDSRET
jgi:hypothetical protein